MYLKDIVILCGNEILVHKNFKILKQFNAEINLTVNVEKTKYWCFDEVIMTSILMELIILKT